MNGGPGNDTITAGDRANPQGLGAISSLTVNGGGGNDTLFLDNTGFTGSTTFFLSSSAVSTCSGVYDYLGLTALTLYTGGSVAAGSTVLVASTAPGAVTTINGGPGNDTIRAGYPFSSLGLTPIGNLTFYGNGGTDSLFLDNTGFGTLTPFPLTASFQVNRDNITWNNGGYRYFGVTQLTLATGSNAFFFSGSSVVVSSVVTVAATNPGTALAVIGGPGPDTLVGPNIANTWTITNTNTGNLDGTVAFSSVENLTGGAASDTFVFHTGGSLSGNINGQNDRATLDYSTFTGDILVDLPLGTATAVAGGISHIVNVTGSIGNDLIVGDAKGNVLIGGTGRNILIGGGGGNTITGGGGDNILIGGTTAYDGNLTALLALMAEFTRTDRSFHQRVNDLKSGTGLNGSYVLNADPTLGPVTVFDNGLADVITGGGGSSWFFYHKANDTINNRKPGDFLTLI
jgi:hypothetical protein